MHKNTSKDRTVVKRVPPKRGFSKMFQGKVTRYRSRISEFEDDTPSSTIVRILVGVLLIHLIVIGGVWLRGSLKKDEAETRVNIPVAQNTATQTQEQPQQNQPRQQQQTTAQTQTPTGAPLITDKNSMAEVPPAVSQPHSSSGQEQIPLALPVDGTSGGQAVQPSVASNRPAVSAPTVPRNDQPVSSGSVAVIEPGPARHIIATGDTWESIARDNNCTVEGLKTVNPGAVLASGATLVIPMKPGEREKVIQARQEEAIRNADVVYVMKRGDTLSKVARQYKVSVASLQKYNNITDPRKVKIGQEIKIPKQ